MVHWQVLAAHLRRLHVILEEPTPDDAAARTSTCLRSARFWRAAQTPAATGRECAGRPDPGGPTMPMPIPRLRASLAPYPKSISPPGKKYRISILPPLTVGTCRLPGG